MAVSSFWDMRLSIAYAESDAEFQNRIILHDNTINLPVVARQPHPDPNYAPQTAARLVLKRHASPRIQERLGPQLVFSPI